MRKLNNTIQIQPPQTSLRKNKQNKIRRNLKTLIQLMKFCQMRRKGLIISGKEGSIYRVKEVIIKELQTLKAIADNLVELKITRTNMLKKNKPSLSTNKEINGKVLGNIATFINNKANKKHKIGTKIKIKKTKMKTIEVADKNRRELKDNISQVLGKDKKMENILINLGLILIILKIVGKDRDNMRKSKLTDINSIMRNIEERGKHTWVVVNLQTHFQAQTL